MAKGEVIETKTRTETIENGVEMVLVDVVTKRRMRMVPRDTRAAAMRYACKVC